MKIKGTAVATMIVAATVLLGASPAAARTIHVGPGDSIQAAVDQAASGDRVAVSPGTYTETGRQCPVETGNTCAVAITKDDISLVAQGGGPVVLQAALGQKQGISVGKTGDIACLDDASLRIDGSLVEGITVKGFEDDGLFLFCVDNWRVTRVSAIDDAEYGIFPSHVGPGRTDHSFASGANDTGIYIGQSHDVRVDHNVATGNVSGFEIENSTGVRLDHNESFGNTGGILTFTLPFLDVKSNHDNVIDHNFVHDNNKPNTCLDPSDAVCGVPVGTGILALAADTNGIRHNEVAANGSFGIAITNFCIAQGLDDATCNALDIEPNSDGNRVEFNAVTGNGGSPDPSIPAFLAKDLVWDGTGTGNCWSHNKAGTANVLLSALPDCR
jgi:parallel beta-helix repeat protein